MFDIHLQYWPGPGGSVVEETRVIPCDAYELKDGQLALSGLRGRAVPDMYFPLALVKEWWVTESEWASD